MSFIRVPPDSTGKKVYTKETTVGGETVQAQIIHIADSENPSFLQRIDRQGASSVRFSDGQPILSGFGSLKVADQHLVAMYEGSIDEYNSLFSIETVAGGTSTFVPVESSQILGVTGAEGSQVTRTTNRYHYYMPGTSNYYNMTISCGDSGKVGNIRRWGAFDDNDGVFFELNGTTFNVVLRSSVTGSVVETRYPQNSWNVDQLNLDSSSQFDLDLTKINVWWIDYQWLGAGRVRFGLFDDKGNRITCHSIENAGQNSLPYMRSGTLPFRTENINTSATGSTSQLRELCASVYIEGDYRDYTFWRHVSDSVTKSIAAPNTHVTTFRSIETINNKHNSINVFPEYINAYATAPVAISIYIGGTVTDGTWDSVHGGSLEENSTGNVSLVGASNYATFYVDTGVTKLDLSTMFETNDEGILRNADGSANEWHIVATALTAGTPSLTFSIGLKELW
jgi:hypothetical protein